MTWFPGPSYPPYHLRPNKAVDRLLFVDLLQTYLHWCPDPPRTYVGLGGAFLEDFRLMAQEFPRMALVCIERDPETKKRQVYHKCSRHMRFHEGSYADFLATEFPTSKPVVVWADYTQMGRDCLSEVSGTARKAVIGSVIRFTVRAKSPAMGALGIKARDYPAQMPPTKQREFEKFRSGYRDRMAVDRVAFPDEWFEWPSFSVDGYPQLLSRMVTAVARGACTAPKRILPLHTSKYSDTTTMMSWTALVCHEDDETRLRKHFAKRWQYFSPDETELALIDVPVLTTKERLALARHLPTKASDGSKTTKALGYLLGGQASEELTKQQLEQYELYFRLYPHFGKIVP